MISKGDAYIKSESDPRWNYTFKDIYVGKFRMPLEVESKIDELEMTFGNRPNNLIFGYMKH